MPDFVMPGTIPSSGTLTVAVKNTNVGKIWEVSQVTAMVGPNSSAGFLGVFKNLFPIGPAAVLAPINTPSLSNGMPVPTKLVNGQTFAGDPYIYLGASDEIQVVLSNCTSGDQCVIRAQYREYHIDDPEVRGIVD